MPSFDPFDRNKAAKDAARDRALAESARKVQAEAELRRKKQLIATHIIKIEQDLRHRRQEFQTLKDETDHITRTLAEKRKGLELLENEVKVLDKTLLEEDRKVKTLSGLLETISSKLRLNRLKVTNLISKERRDTDSVAHQKSLLLTMTKRQDAMVIDFDRINQVITTKEAELRKLNQERDEIKRKLEDHKQIIVQAQHDLKQTESLEQSDDKETSHSKTEEEKLLSQSTDTELQIRTAQAAYQQDVNKKTLFIIKRNDIANFINTNGNVLRQKELKMRTLESEIRRIELDLAEKQRELQRVLH